MKKRLLSHKLLLLFITVFYVQSSYSQTTYTVTSTSVGPNTTSGTFLWAVDQANNNTGADIIEFTPGLQVNASATNVSLQNSIMALINESVTIDGKGSSLNGYQLWVTQGGIVNPLSDCPNSTPSLTQYSYMPGFVAIGTRGQDNSAIEVTIKNLTVKQFNQVAQIADNASLILDNFTGLETWGTLQCAGEPMINGVEGASLTIKNSLFENAKNWGTIPFAASIYMGQNAGDLIIENSRFRDLTFGSQPAVYHSGVAGSKLNIVSSRFYQSGGIETFGAVETNIVNSIWTNKATLIPSISDRIINNSSGDMNIIASSIMWNTNQCDGLCGASMDNQTSLIEIRAEGDINFLQSAVGFNFDPSTGAPALLTLGVATGGTATKGVFTADEYTYIEPTTIQDAAALNTLVTTPPSTSLLTGVGFIRGVVPTTGIDTDVALVTPAADGELIDPIPSVITLINPIDGSTIAFDVVGNPREDANSKRDIGALQLALAPFLSVSSSGDSQVALSWNEPLHHDGLDIVRYEVTYDVSGGSSPTTIPIDLPALTQTISGLTNGTAYEFKVRAIYNSTGTEENGPYSNIVIATPIASIGDFTVTAAPGDSEVALSWTQPDLGGRDFDAYTILWRVQGTTLFIGQLATYSPSETNITVTGLTNGTTYEFVVTVNASGDTNQGSTTATPDVGLGIDDLDLLNGKFSYYPNPVDDYLHIDIEENFTAKLFSINGALLMDIKSKKNIDVSKFNTGIYILQIQVEDKTYSGKILKK